MLRPDDATHLAEQATLGALILDPTHLGAVRPWLRAGDFADALHGQVYAALCERHTAGEPTDPAAMVGALTGRAPGMSPGVRVHDLIAAVPAVDRAPGSSAQSETCSRAKPPSNSTKLTGTPCTQTGDATSRVFGHPGAAQRDLEAPSSALMAVSAMNFVEGQDHHGRFDRHGFAELGR